MANVGIREYSTLRGEERILLLKNLLGIRLALTALGLCLAVIFAVAAGYRSVLVAGTILSGIGLLLALVQQTVGVPLASRLQLGWLSLLDLLRQAITVAIVVALVAVGASLLPFLAAPIPVSLLMLALTVPLVRRMAPLLPSFDRAEWSRIIRMTLAYSAAAAVGTIYVSVTVILTSLVGTSHETGYYGASYRIFSVLGNIPLFLVGSAFPVLARAARDDRERLGYALQRLLETGLVISAWLALCTGLGAGFLIDVVAGSGFGRAVGALEIQSVALIGTFIAVTLGFALLSERKHTAVLVANAIALVIGSALTLALVPSFGVKGAALATVVGEFSLATVYGIALFVPAKDLRPTLEVIPKVALAAGLALALTLVPKLDDVALVTAASVVYILVLLVLRGVPAEIGEALFGFRGRSAA